MTDKVPNKERGEVGITLDGKALIMRPTPEAAVSIEARTGRGMRALGRRVIEGEATLDELSAIVFEGVRATGDPAVFKIVRDVVFKTGYTAVEAQVLQFLVNITTGGRQDDAPGEAKAAGTTTGPTTAA